MSKRRGRPRKSGDRYPSGKLREPKDRGTPKTRARQAWFGDLTTFPLGVMRANDVITADQLDAGCRYAWLYAVVNSVKVHTTAQQFEKVPAGRDRREMDPRRMVSLTGRYRIMRGLLDEFGEIVLSGRRKRRMRDIFESVVVFERMPNWLLPTRPSGEDLLLSRALIIGLERLVEYQVRGD